MLVPKPRKGHTVKRSLIAFLLCLGTVTDAAVAADASWSVSEGPGGATRGIWQLQFKGNRIAGSAEMVGTNGSKISYRLSGERKNGEYILQRGNPSDGVPCAYRGRIGGNGRAVGAVLCSTGASTWSATRK